MSQDKYHAELLLSALSNDDDNDKAKSVLAVAKLDHQIDPEWSDYAHGTYHYDSAVKALAGLQLYKWSSYQPPADISDEEDQAAMQARALVTVAYRMWEAGDEDEMVDDSIAIQDGRLVSLILERPEDAEEIAETVRVTGQKNGDVIREMLASASKSMRSGML